MKKGLKIVGNILLWLFVVIAVFMTIIAFSSTKNQNGVAVIFGRMPITILSESMDPTLKKGDLIISHELSADQKGSLKEDDIITYKVDLNGDGFMELNTHRIISIRTEGGYVYYTTKGDNNAIADTKEVRYDAVVGVYNGRRVPGIGSVLNFLQTPPGFLVCVVIPLVLFLLYEIYNFIKVMISMKTDKQSKQYEEEIKKKAIEEYLAKQNMEQGKSESDSDSEKS
ncbi:MAG: Signal peptidase I W [Firmicutes bacterium ADurb.Bin146]|nr:MAG: Signal peptidase I W [Firmicutes bacterium ADurb.Bin146]